VSAAERRFVEALARHWAGAATDPIPTPVVGYEAEGGIPIDFAWPDARIAVFLDLGNLDAEDRRVLELNRWRVLANDPDTILTALKEAA
jgi:hypothetical protein